MANKISRDDAADFLYIVYNADETPAKSFENEEDAYGFADDDQRVVTYKKA